MKGFGDEVSRRKKDCLQSVQIFCQKFAHCVCVVACLVATVSCHVMSCHVAACSHVGALTLYI